jgi:hypothetical protein
MAMGRTWIESFQKALRGMEAGLDGWALPRGYKRLPKDQLLYNLRVPNPDRMIHLKQVRHLLYCWFAVVHCVCPVLLIFSGAFVYALHRNPACRNQDGGRGCRLKDTLLSSY